MMSTAARPLGITIIAIVVILSGIAQVLTAVDLLDWIGFMQVPERGDPQVSGWAALIIGAINIAVGVGLFTLERWAWKAKPAHARSAALLGKHRSLLRGDGSRDSDGARATV